MSGRVRYEAGRLLFKAVSNYLQHRPLVISYEVTLSCNCDCRHCDLGGVRRDETRIGPCEYSTLTARYGPPVVQISGGEPLLRDDLPAIVRAVSSASPPTYVIVVTNGVLLTREVYLALKEAGMSQLSVSLDFPDERHDDFRQHPGLFAHLERVLPELARLGNGDIIMNTAITRANLRVLREVAGLCELWGVAVSFSAYTHLRTGDTQYLVQADEDLACLRSTMDELIHGGRHKKHVANPPGVLRDTVAFFERGGMPGCRAGERFFVVMPDGMLVPCSQHRERYCAQEQMVTDFTARNRCDKCYVAIRSYADKPLWRLVSQDLPSLSQRLFDRYLPE